MRIRRNELFGIRTVRFGLVVLALTTAGCVSTRLHVSDDHPARAGAAPASSPAAAILEPGAPLYQPEGAEPTPMEGHEHHMPPAEPPAPEMEHHEHHGEPEPGPPPADPHEHHKPGPGKAPGKGPGR